MTEPRRYRIGLVELDPAQDRLSGPAGRVHLEPRVCDFAVFLARRAGEVVHREALIEAVWNNYPGADQSLTNAASKMRTALDEAGGDREFLQTVPKRGYRLIEAVPLDDRPAGARSRRRRPIFAAIAAAVVATVVLVLGSLDGEADPPSIAVLAFEDLSPQGDHQYLSHGISEELLNLLTRIPDLRVVGRTSSFSFAGKDVTVSEIGKQLGVDHVLEGSVRRSGNRLRITVQLLEAEKDRHLWSNTYQLPLDDVFAVQDRIAESVARELKARLGDRLPNVPTTDAQTHALYLRAKFLLDRVYPEEGGALLEQALERDPDYVPALALRVAHDFRTGRPERSRAALNRILELDPDHALAHVYLAWGRFMSGHNPVAALPLLEQGLDLGPGDPQVLRYSARLLRAMGLFEPAIAVAERGVRFDPLCTRCLYQLARAYLHAGRLDQAEAAIRRFQDLAKGGWLTLGTIRLLRGEPEAAMAAFERMPPPMGSEAWWLSNRAIALFELGQTERARELLKELETRVGARDPRAIARVHVWLGNADEAFAWLERDVASYFDALAGAPILSRLRTDERWSRLLAPFGISPEQREELSIELPFG